MLQKHLKLQDFRDGIDYAAHHVMMFACSELDIPMTVRGEHMIDRCAEAATLNMPVDKFCIDAVKKWLTHNAVAELNYQFAFLNTYYQDVAHHGCLTVPERFHIDYLDPGRIITFAASAPIMTVRCSYNIREKGVA